MLQKKKKTATSSLMSIASTVNTSLREVINAIMKSIEKSVQNEIIEK